jgi:hypothetical protein
MNKSPRYKDKIMIYTLCQRLIEGPNIGFEYDYMGASEYEFGSTGVARKHLANAPSLIRLPGQVKVHTNNTTYDCTFIVSSKDEAAARELIEVLGKGDYRNKGVMAYTSRSPLGWLILDPVPALVHMIGDDGAERAQKFLDNGATQFAKA